MLNCGAQPRLLWVQGEGAGSAMALSRRTENERDRLYSKPWPEHRDELQAQYPGVNPDLKSSRMESQQPAIHHPTCLHCEIVVFSGKIFSRSAIWPFVHVDPKAVQKESDWHVRLGTQGTGRSVHWRES
jgi:hypothetical protein